MLQQNPEIIELLRGNFLTLLDYINDPVIIINKDGLVVYINSAYEYQVGIPKEKILNKNLYEKHPDDKLLKILENRKQIEQDICYYDETLGYHIVANFIPLKCGDGKIKGVIGVGNSKTISIITEHFRSIVVRSKKNKLEKINTPNLKYFNSIISNDPRMLHCLNIATNVAKTDVSVMLRGETGTGKELFADAIHRASNRSKQPFVAINCSAIPENLLEAELFGYTSGAFTGANPAGKTGKIERANNGTLFLDEIGDSSLNIQVKLLRFTQEKYIEKVGGTKKIPVNVRIIAATNRNLEQMVQQNEFRADLFYRLCVVPIFIPPLRERFTDISFLSIHFLNNFAKVYGKNLSFTPDAIDYLQNYSWPGNVRELKNVIEHAVIMCQKDKLAAKDLQPKILNIPIKTKPGTLRLNVAIEELEKSIIKQALSETKYNKSKAINLLGISRSAFYDKLEKYNIS
jgi:PAS domain S-box-containing protein